jgi:hypothetical protein
MIEFDVKDGVILPPMLQLLYTAARVFAAHGAPCVITSGKDGRHKEGSLHYKDRALDFRTRHLRGQNEADQVAQEMRDRLGRSFDIVVEADHIHAEYDPKE